jgi:hypothetical protein
MNRLKGESGLDQLNMCKRIQRRSPCVYNYWIGFLCFLLYSPGTLWANDQGLKDHTQGSAHEFSSLNIRMSNRSIAPPPDLISKTLPLEGITVARPFEGPAPQAAILENDHRQRVALLSQNSAGTWQLYLLEPIPLDPQLPALFQCAEARQCETDRMPITGGLACLALCAKELIEATALDNH